MMFTDKSSGTAVPKKAPKKKKTRPQGLPSPALCCACGLCIMLAGINITLVGAFAFGTLLPAHNPPIVIGPVLLLVALAFFGACCVCSRRPAAPGARKPKSGGGMGLSRLSGTAFEIETSEHTLQDTTAVQLSPTNSPSSSRASSPAPEPPRLTPNLFTMETDGPAPEPPRVTPNLFTMETDGPASACYFASASDSGGGAVKLNLPRDPLPPSAEGC